MKRHIWVVALLAAVMIIGGWLWAQQSTPTATPESTATPASTAPVSLTTPNLNQPARYAFITDKAAPKLAVFDTYERQLLPSIPLKTTADSIGMSRYGGYLAYAKNGDKQLYLLDLNTQQHQSFSVSAPIESLAVQVGGRWITYTGAAGSGIIDTKNGHETTIATQGETTLLYPPSADSVLLAETTRGRIQRVSLADGQIETLLDSGSPLSAISMMPNGMALFFVADGVLQRYSLLDDSLQALNIAAAPWRPYVTSDSRLVLVFSPVSANQPPELVAVNAYTYQEKYRIPLANWQAPARPNQDAIATGWLEQVAVIADNNALYSLALATQPATIRHSENPARIRDMLVQADSKTLLATRDNSDKLWIFNLREQRFAAPVQLDLGQPDNVVMGETNTLCH